MPEAPMIPRSRIVHAVDPAPLYLYGVNSKNQTVAVPGGSVALSVTGFGAKGDGVTDDTAAIQAAIDAVAAQTTADDISGYNAQGGEVHLPPGCYRISSSLEVKNFVRLVGANRRSTMIAVLPSFPEDGEVITIGALGSGVVFNSSVESLTINCNRRADLIGVRSTRASEGCWLRDLMIRGTYRSVLFENSGFSGPGVPGTPTETLIEDCEFWVEGDGGPAAPRYAVDYDDCEQSHVIRHCTIYDIDLAGGSGSAAVRVNSSSVQIHHLHIERLEVGVLVDGGSTVWASAVEHYNGSANAAVKIASTASGSNRMRFENIFIAGAGTVYAIKDDASSYELSGTTFARCHTYDFRSSAAGSVLRPQVLFLQNTNSTSATALDYYLEGTFTPSINFNGASVGVTYATQSGNYTRIGNRVFFDVFMGLTSKGSSTGELRINGLPVLSSAGGSYPAACRVNLAASDLGAQMYVGDVIAETTQARIVTINIASGTETSLPITNDYLTDSSQIIICGSYRCA